MTARTLQIRYKNLLILIVVTILSYVLVHKLFRKEFIELNLLITKYCYINIPQNSGFHKFILQVIQKGTVFLPSLHFVPLDRHELEVGVGSYSNKQFYKQNTIIRQLQVETEQQIVQAITTATAGTEIIIAPGIYFFGKNKIAATANSGEAFLPIIVKARNYGEVIIAPSAREGLVISQPFWRVENLIFKGEKRKKDTWIDHAIHIINNADGVSIAHNAFVNFNAHIKVNGGTHKATSKREFPDYGVIEHNNFYNEWKRNTSRNAVVPIDIVGGNDWLVKNNFIADFGKNGQKGRGITTGAYIKGASSNGRFENNLVACEWKIPHSNPFDIRIGLSFGGGGTGQQFCRNKECSFEHNLGEINENVIINCTNDVGIYLYKAQNTKIENNYIFNTLGVDVRLSPSNAIIQNNFMDGRIRPRDGGKILEKNNIYREKM